MSTIKANQHQVGSNVTADKNIVLTTDVSTGDLVINKGVFDGTLTEISRILNAGGGQEFTQAGTGAVSRSVSSKLQESVSVLDFGAVGDSNIYTGGGTNDTAAINLAIAYCVSSGKTLTAPSGYCFRITSAIDMRFVKSIDWQGQIYCDSITTGPAVTFGGFSSSASNNLFFFNQINDGGALDYYPTYPLLRIWGLKNSQVTVLLCRYVQIYADEAVTNCTSVAYNTFNFDYVARLDLRGATSYSWINENVFNGGRHRYLNIGATTTEYIHNHNIWNFPTFEGVISIEIVAGAFNRIKNARFEGVNQAGAKVEISSVSYENFIYSQYDTDPYGSQFLDQPVWPQYVLDYGQNNVIMKDITQYYNKIPLFTLDARTQMVANSTAGTSTSYATTNQKKLFDKGSSSVYGVGHSFVPGLKYIQSLATFRDVYASDYLPVEVGDGFAFQFETQAALFRVVVKIYDANFALLGAVGAGGAYLTGGNVTYDGAGTYASGTQLPSTTSSSVGTGSIGIGVRRSEVKYIRIALVTGSVTGNITFATLYYFQKMNKNSAQFVASNLSTRTMMTPSIPTCGFVSTGTQVSKEDGTAIYLCSYSNDTTLNGGLAGGATSVTVTTIGSVANGDVVGILLNDGTTHWSSVSALAGSTFTISALPSIASTGNRVVFNRWATK